MKAWMIGAAAAALLGGAAQAGVFVGGETGGVVTPYATPGLASGASFSPYAGYTGGVRVAVGDVNGDGVADLVTGTGPGAGPVVKVFDGRTGAELRAFNAFEPTFTGGVRVAVGDLNGDGKADIVVGAGGGSSNVRVFDGQNGDTLHSFEAFAGSTAGVSVAVSQDDAGRASLIVGAGAGDAPVVKVFDPTTGLPTHTFFAFAPTFLGGVNVAGLTKVGPGQLILGAASLSSEVRVIDLATRSFTHSFFAFDGFTGGVSVAGGDFGGLTSLFIGQQTGGSNIKVFDSASGRGLAAFRSATGGDGVNVAASFAVPEPATWAMMILGFGLAGTALRRRRLVSLP